MGESSSLSPSPPLLRPSNGIESRTLLNATLTSAINPVGVAPGQTPPVINLSQHFDDPNVPGTLVDVTTPLGVIPIALTDSKTPNTVANFLSYINSGAYNGTIFHRLATGFALQGGGYTTSGNPIATNPPINGEPGQSNVTGSIAMALTSCRRPEQRHEPVVRQPGQQ